MVGGRKWSTVGARGRGVRMTAMLAAVIALSLIAGAPAAVAATQCGNAGPWCNSSLSPDRRAQLLLDVLSESQKISLLAGTPGVGVDGASGHTGYSAGGSSTATLACETINGNTQDGSPAAVDGVIDAVQTSSNSS
jgi:hypothetical protein